MQHLEVSGAVRHIYIYIYVIRRLKVKAVGFAQRESKLAQNCDSRYESPDYAPNFRCISRKLLSAYFVNQNSTCLHLLDLLWFKVVTLTL